VLPDTFPFRIAQPNHPSFIGDGLPAAILR
jgi:hypothetical protein